MTPTIKHRRLLALTTLAITLCAAPAAGAHDPHKERGGGVVAPAKDKWLGESWAQIYSLPLSENPFAGNGNPCLTLAHKVIQEIGGPCTIEQGTAFMLAFGSAWSNVEDPFPQTREEQLAVATAADREFVAGMTVTVDGGDPVEIRTPRFELFSPQRTVLLPADNGLGVPSQIVTLSAHGWGAVVRKLGVGDHDVVGDTLFADGEHFVVHHILTVVPRTHSDQDRAAHNDNLQDHAHD
jgi:hypothetical protein